MEKNIALALSLIPNLKANERTFLAKTFNNTETVQNLSVFHLTNNDGVKVTPRRKEKWANLDGRDLLDEADALLEKLAKRHINVICITDKNYPPLLKEIFDPPFLLYYKGELADPEQPSLSVVGTRRPSLRGKQETAFFVRECCKSLGSIVSGLAMGIDGMAHRATLEEFSHTTAVLGSGFNFIYPTPHKSLAARIVDEGGLLLSEYHPDTPATQYNFPERNRIVSGLSRGTIVMEAPPKSGTLITADFALEQGRDLFVQAGALDIPNTGVSALYEQGAIALNRGTDLLSLWNLSTHSSKKPLINPPPNENESKTKEKPSGLKKKQYQLDGNPSQTNWEEIDIKDLTN